MLAVFKRQWFKNSRSDKMKPRGSKYQRLDECDNEEENGLDDEEENGLDKNEGEIESDRYVLPPFVPLFLFPQKVSNRLSDLGERIKSLEYIVYISKICYSRNTNFALEFPGRRGSKTPKEIYTCYLRKGLAFYLTSTAFTGFGTTNHHYLIKKYLESYPSSNHCQDLGTQLCANQQ